MWANLQGLFQRVANGQEDAKVLRYTLHAWLQGDFTGRAAVNCILEELHELLNIVRFCTLYAGFGELDAQLWPKCCSRGLPAAFAFYFHCMSHFCDCNAA